jgi:hypothetical protein
MRGMFRRAATVATAGTVALVPILYASLSLAQGGARLVGCHVETSRGKVELSGRCRFTPETDGSFELDNANADRPLFGSILSLSVAIVEPGSAEVRGLTKSGINSRWGMARRSAKDPACWEGADFRICAR